MNGRNFIEGTIWVKNIKRGFSVVGLDEILNEMTAWKDKHMREWGNGRPPDYNLEMRFESLKRGDILVSMVLLLVRIQLRLTKKNEQLLA